MKNALRCSDVLYGHTYGAEKGDMIILAIEKTGSIYLYGFNVRIASKMVLK